MNALHRALSAFRAAARRLELPLDAETRDDRGRLTRYTSAKAVLDALVPLLEAQGLHIGVLCTDTPQPGKLVLTGVLVHESGCTEPFHEVETFGGTTGLTLAGARTLALSAVYLNLAQVRTEREEVEAEPEAQPVKRASKPDQTVAARAQGMRACLIQLAQMGCPEAMNWVSWIDRTSEPTHAELNRIEKWAAAEMKRAIERHQAEAAKQAQAATEAAPSAGGTSPFPVPSVATPAEGSIPDAPVPPAESPGGPEHAGPPVSGNEGGAETAPAPPPPHCSVCGVGVWHVQRDGQCWEACSFCRAKSATFFLWKGKGAGRHKQRWCPDCTESESPKGKREPITGPAPVPYKPSEEEKLAAAALQVGATQDHPLTEMPAEEREARLAKLPAQGDGDWGQA